MKEAKRWLQISGKTRRRTHILAPIETKIINFLCPLVPKFIQTYHLTWSALISILGVLVFSFLARENILWLWGVIAMIVMHFITDALDGEIGRRRDTGLVKWGFYVDHFLDFIFSTSMLLGYFFIFDNQPLVFMILILFLGGFFTDNLMHALSLDEYQTSGYFGVGPTEVYVFLIILNICLMLFEDFPVIEIFIAVDLFFAIVLINSLLKTQKKLWKIDMRAKIKK